ncbi:MAG: succinate dehydrogenase, cytochrome b556 subunit [Stagnimonas sp.]|nr:succinate dehydrogenase, cytochrome b556 subunit [Stagnimonas sp.]
MSTPATSKTTPTRPLSPFMIGPYYKPQMTSMLSITHRLTGLGLSFGAILLVTWLVCLASGVDCYNMILPHLTAWYGKLVLVAFTWALLYHFCNGIRHLMWDLGKGLDMPTAEKTGWGVIVVSIAVTAAVWALALATK